MTRLMMAGVMAVMVAMGTGVPVWAGEEDGSQIKIVSPENGAVVKGDMLELKYELAKGQHATHAHVYLDGQYQKGFSGTFKGLAPGKHEIKVVAANHDHKALAAEAVVTVDVQ